MGTGVARPVTSYWESLPTLDLVASGDRYLLTYRDLAPGGPLKNGFALVDGEGKRLLRQEYGNAAPRSTRFGFVPGQALSVIYWEHQDSFELPVARDGQVPEDGSLLIPVAK